MFNLLVLFSVLFFGSFSLGATSTLSSGEAPICEVILSGIGDSHLAAAQSKIPGYEGSHRLDVTIATKVPLSGIRSEDPGVRAVATSEAAFWAEVVQETTRALSLVPRLLDHVPSINLSFSPPPDRGLPESKQPHMVPTLGGATKGQPKTRIVFPYEAEVRLAGRYGPSFPKEMSETEKIARIKSVRGHEIAHAVLEVALWNAIEEYAQAFDDVAIGHFVKERTQKLWHLLDRGSYNAFGSTDNFLGRVDRKIEFAKSKGIDRPDAHWLVLSAAHFKMLNKMREKFSAAGSKPGKSANYALIWNALRPMKELWSDFSGMLNARNGENVDLEFTSHYPNTFYETKDGRVVTEIEAFKMADKDLGYLTIDPRGPRIVTRNFSLDKGRDFGGACQTCTGVGEAEILRALGDPDGWEFGAYYFFEPFKKEFGKKYGALLNHPKTRAQVERALFYAVIESSINTIIQLLQEGETSGAIPQARNRTEQNSKMLQLVASYMDGQSIHLPRPHEVRLPKVNLVEAFKPVRIVPEVEKPAGLHKSLQVAESAVFADLDQEVTVFKNGYSASKEASLAVIVRNLETGAEEFRTLISQDQFPSDMATYGGRSVKTRVFREGDKVIILARSILEGTTSSKLAGYSKVIRLEIDLKAHKLIEARQLPELEQSFAREEVNPKDVSAEFNAWTFSGDGSLLGTTNRFESNTYRWDSKQKKYVQAFSLVHLTESSRIYKISPSGHRILVIPRIPKATDSQGPEGATEFVDGPLVYIYNERGDMLGTSDAEVGYRYNEHQETSTSTDIVFGPGVDGPETMYIVKKHSKSFSQPDGRALDGRRIGGTHGQVFESAQVLLLKESGGAQETKDHPLDFTVEAVYGFSFRSDVFREKLRNKIEPKALRVTAKTVDRSRDLIWFRVELPNSAGTYGGHPSQMQAIRLSEFEAWLTTNKP